MPSARDWGKLLGVGALVWFGFAMPLVILAAIGLALFIPSIAQSNPGLALALTLPYLAVVLLLASWWPSLRFKSKLKRAKGEWSRGMECFENKDYEQAIDAFYIYLEFLNAHERESAFVSRQIHAAYLLLDQPQEALEALRDAGLLPPH